MNERSIFLAALEKNDPAERAAYLDEACAGDAGLRQRVDQLLKAHEEAGNVLERPAVAAEDTGDDIPGRWLDPAALATSSEGPGSRIGPYKLLQELGEGGMGTVYLAEQEEPVRRRVALKIIKAGMDSRQVIARFEAERQALALMDHPNIAKVLDAGTTESPPPLPSPVKGEGEDRALPPRGGGLGWGGRPYFVMELVKGIPITKFCDQEHLMPRERLELFIPVCQAVQHAHQKGIIHRDLKPSNVLIALYDGKPVPKVIDFGVAKATGQRLTEKTLFTEVGQIVGTLEYMAPEQAELNNLDIDTRADIYALGVLLYELLTGSPPFSGKQLRSAAFDEMLRMIREVEPPKPSTKLSSSEELPSIAAKRKLEPKKLTRLVRGDLDWIVMKCLEKERGRRYETANGVALDVQRYLHDEPVLAGPPSASYRLRKFLRKHRAGVLTAAALVVLLVLGVVISTWQAVRATAAERWARAEEAKAVTERDEKEQARRQAVAAAEAEKKAKEAEVAQRKQAEAVANALETVLLGIKPNQTLTDFAIQLQRTLALTLHSLQKEYAVEAPVRARLSKALEHANLMLGVTRKELAEARRSLAGPDHLDTLTTSKDITPRSWDMDLLVKALPLFEQTLENQKAKLGPDHFDTLTSMNNLAMLYWSMKKLDRSIPLLEDALKRRKAKLGPDDPNTLGTQANLGINYRDAGRFAEAIPLLEGAYQKGRRYAQLEWVGDALLAVYTKAGKTKEATALVMEQVQFARKQVPADSPHLAGPLAAAGKALLDAKAYADAESLLRECLALREKSAPDAWTFNTQSLLGGALLGQQKYADAEPLLLKGYEGMKACEKTIPPESRARLTEALERLVQLYDAWGKKDEAAKWRKEWEAAKAVDKK